jgi:hypothetical protein
MFNNAADFETLKQELRNKLADLERDFPDAVDQIATHRRTVDDFCNKEIPTTKDSRTQLWRKQMSIKMTIGTSWLSLNRIRLWSRFNP